MTEVQPYPKGGQPKRRKPRPTPRPKRTDLPDAREACARRADWACEARCGDGCLGRGDQAHHRLMRSQGGSDDVENLLWVCRWCHDQIHSHPAASYLRGWLIRGVTSTVRVVS